MPSVVASMFSAVAGTIDVLLRGTETLSLFSLAFRVAALYLGGTCLDDGDGAE